MTGGGWGTTVNCSTGAWQAVAALPHQTGEPWAQVTVAKRTGLGREATLTRVPPDPGLAATASHR